MGPVSLAIEPAFYDHTVDLYEGDTLADVRYGRWNDRNGPGGRYLLPARLSGSDYSGSLVEASNYRSFTETYADGADQWWTHTPGGHATYGVLIDRASIPAEIVIDVAEFLGALEDYPIADDDLHSTMEIEAQGEAWERWARREFVQALETAHDLDLDAADDDRTFELFQRASDTANVYWENQQGTDVYINVERVAAAVSESEARALVAAGA